MRRLLIFLFGFTLGYSTRFINTPPDLYAPVSRGPYAYIRVADAVYYVAAFDNISLQSALNEIHCRPDNCTLHQQDSFFVAQVRLP